MPMVGYEQKLASIDLLENHLLILAIVDILHLLSVFVSPEIDEEFEIDINPADLRIDYLSSKRSAGGQHVNTTDSAYDYPHCQQVLWYNVKRIVPSIKIEHKL